MKKYQKNTILLLFFILICVQSAYCISDKCNNCLNQIGINTYKNDINEIEKKINLIEAVNNNIRNDITTFLSVYAWIGGIVIASVSIIFAIVSIFIISENKDLTRDARKQINDTNDILRECKELRDSYKKDIELEMINSKNKFLEFIQDSRRDINGYAYHMLLQIQLENGDKNIERIFALLTPLVNHPKREYIDVFINLRNIDLDSEINSMVNTALSKIES